MFENADLIHRYTRADAIRDGVFVDVSATPVLRPAHGRAPPPATETHTPGCPSVPTACHLSPASYEGPEVLASLRR
jgi:hypothetical protein